MSKTARTGGFFCHFDLYSRAAAALFRFFAGCRASRPQNAPDGKICLFHGVEAGAGVHLVKDLHRHAAVLSRQVADIPGRQLVIGLDGPFHPPARPLQRQGPDAQRPQDLGVPHRQGRVDGGRQLGGAGRSADCSQLYALQFYTARCKHSALRAPCSQRFTPESGALRPTLMPEASKKPNSLQSVTQHRFAALSARLPKKRKTQAWRTKTPDATNRTGQTLAEFSQFAFRILV